MPPTSPCPARAVMLCLLAAALCAPARALGMAGGTVDTHLKSAFRKLGATSLMEAIRIGTERGEVECFCKQKPPGPPEQSSE